MAKQLSDDASPIAGEIYRRMQSLGLNPTSMAAKVGTNSTYFRDLFVGKFQQPGSNWLPKIADALECSVIALINPGRPDGEPRTQSIIDEPDEMALIAMWRTLTREGRVRVMQAIITEAARIASEKK